MIQRLFKIKEKTKLHLVSVSSLTKGWLLWKSTSKEFCNICARQMYYQGCEGVTISMNYPPPRLQGLAKPVSIGHILRRARADWRVHGLGKAEGGGGVSTLGGGSWPGGGWRVCHRWRRQWHPFSLCSLGHRPAALGLPWLLQQASAISAQLGIH